MKRLLVILSASLIFLCSCRESKYFGYELNRVSRVYSTETYALPAAYTDSFDLYQNPLQPMAAFTDKIWYFAASEDPYNQKPPMLYFYDKASGKAAPLCTDPNCAHNNYNFTVRCALCDLTDYSRVNIYDGKLYYTCAYRTEKVSESGKTTYYMPNPGAPYDEIEVPHRLMSYDLESGEAYTLYEVPAGSYLDGVCIYGGCVYFTETHYAERKNLVYYNQDYTWVYFNDTENGGVTRRPLTQFCIKQAMKQDKIKEIEETGQGYFSVTYYKNLRYNRMYKVGGDRLWEKVYTFSRLDLKTNAVTALADGLEREPRELRVFGRSLYAEFGDMCVRYDLDYSPGSRTVVADYAKLGAESADVSSLQYDQYTDTLYFLAKKINAETGKAGEAGSVYYVKLFEDGVRTPPRRLSLGEGDIVTGYQLANDGIFFTAARVYAPDADPVNYPSLGIDYNTAPNSGSLYFLSWLDKYASPAPYYAVWDSAVTGTPIFLPTVIGSEVYACTAGLKIPGYYFDYSLYRIPIKLNADASLYASAASMTPVSFTDAAG